MEQGDLSTYPLGGQLTLSAERWDTRAALVGSAPTRTYAINRAGNPRATPVLVTGAGITPTAGSRKPYTRTDLDQQVAASLVWTRRWW